MGVEQAIRAAMDYVGRLFEGSDHRLEEVTLQDDDSWEITVSFRPADRAHLAASGVVKSGARRTLGVDESRDYKVVTVLPDASVKSVRIRPITVG